MNGKPVLRQEIEEEQEYLRAWLDVCDGIYFNYPAAFRNKDHTFDEAFYRDVFIPVFKSVLSEPAYQDKYLSFPVPRPASNIGFTAIGDSWAGDAFWGHLRRLRIVHDVE